MTSGAAQPCDLAAIGFTGGIDPRVCELERRVVLSQYLTAVNCSGNTLPPQENGLITDFRARQAPPGDALAARGQFHSPGPPERLERGLAGYLSALPEARTTIEEDTPTFR
ncbi:hypothetical protein OG440_33950 [Streptomyces sp. NBC_00637]|uniref:hypothetical protein n=1 Tax=Streptomyces sp. NBC_00637 TaxID=2903667 RepID=UPI003249D627